MKLFCARPDALVYTPEILKGEGFNVHYISYIQLLINPKYNQFTIKFRMIDGSEEINLQYITAFEATSDFNKLKDLINESD